MSNPVPRVKHPDWLHKRVMEKSATHKQKKITDLFTVLPKDKNKDNSAQDIESCDIEDMAGKASTSKQSLPIVNKRKRQSLEGNEVENANKSWKDVLGLPPPMGTTKEERLKWLEFHKQKWAFQAKQRAEYQKSKKKKRSNNDGDQVNWGITRNINTSTLGGFLRRTQKKLLVTPWQIIQVRIMF